MNRPDEPERWNIPEPLRQRMVEIARLLRKQATPSERILWDAVRTRKLDGRKIRRQQPIGPFAVDFYCAQERLIIEIDGSIHDEPEQQALDAERQALLETLGLRFVRVRAELVEQDLPAALDQIRSAFLPASPPSPLVGEGAGGEG